MAVRTAPGCLAKTTAVCYRQFDTSDLRVANVQETARLLPPLP